jgi:mRNA interferase RelE/StbE
MTVLVTDKARRFYENAGAPLQQKLMWVFKLLADTPKRHPQIKPLKGSWRGYYRFRIGDYRVVYSIDDAKKTVIIHIIAHRREVYQ